MNNNYVSIKVDGKWMHEHRYVMSVYLGRPLVKGEVVHHKDGNKRNNELGNLELMTKLAHDRLNPTKFKLRHRDKNPKIATRRREIEHLYGQGVSFRKIAAMLGIHHGTVQHYLRRDQVLASRHRKKYGGVFGTPSQED